MDRSRSCGDSSSDDT